MKTNDAGHKETATATELPEPLGSMGVWSAVNFSLPSRMLSLASAFVLSVVAVSLQLGHGHELFVLPRPGTFVIGMIAAGLSWWIGIRCRPRPGRLGPRLWTIFLAVFNTIVAVAGLVWFDRASVLALAVGGLAAAVTLAPRLLKVRPDSAVIQNVAPFTAIMILLLVLPSACAVRHAIATATADRVEHRIQQYRLWTTDLGEIANFDWRRIEDNPDAASAAIAKLRQFDFASTKGDAELWRSAGMLGKDAELAQAMKGLTDQVVVGFAPQRVPRVSDLKEAAVRWDAQEKRWESYSRFQKLSEITGSYHAELGRLFSELRDVPADDAHRVEYRQHYDAQRQLLQRALLDMANSWGDNWAAFRVPDHADLIGRENEPLTDLLRAPFANDDETLTAGNLARLATLPLSEVKRCSRGSPGCSGVTMSPEKRSVQGAPGCRCQDFRESTMEYFRLDCYSYLPRREDTGADLRVEMRLVYHSEPHGLLRNLATPSEVFFHFLLPEGSDESKFREEVMTALAATTREGNAQVRSIDRGGSAAGGFYIETPGNSLRVFRPAVVKLTGLNPEPKALQVRVVPLANNHYQVGD